MRYNYNLQLCLSKILLTKLKINKIDLPIKRIEFKYKKIKANNYLLLKRDTCVEYGYTFFFLNFKFVTKIQKHLP